MTFVDRSDNAFWCSNVVYESSVESELKIIWDENKFGLLLM